MGKPDIRFKGYTDEWEQRKVSEIAIEKLSNGIMNNQSDDETGVKHINVINMYDTDKIHSEKLTFSNYDEEAVKKCNVEFGDIFLTRSSLKPEGIAEANVLLDSGRFVYDDHLIRLKVNKEKYDPFFVKLNLSGNAFKRQFIVRAKTTAFTTIGQEDISECLGFFPKKEEQQQIGEYFMILDHLITLHQRKCDEVKSLKKYMLQKMFPQNEQKVPEIRFEGFTEAWEQRKLGEVFKEYSEKNHTELSALTIIQGGGTVKREESDRNLMYDKSNLSNYKMVRKNDFIVHLRSFEGGLEKSLLDGIISPAYHTFHSDVADSRFYYPYFRSHEFIKHKLVPHVYGIRDGRSIDIAGMKTIEIPYTSIEEQRKIGDYLESLDHLITLHQQKCEELKKIKKFMLQKMFV
ncbi:restriction endonuclease subunit S [Blautia wexlerae]|uniref:restriction endonuclease subunit S n=1 Tax=Blautia wexlerae TaxID=418240 RepID=UPI0015715762|nr:restriction endonuclease subunit S [Blautia wexlerae]NSF25350.1 restriction endonuclease subunit S [Blautia wexlerae]